MADNKCSGYLQVYNDWELLEASLSSFKGFIDELIVVDGCYEWMAAYYSSIGYTAEKSQKKIYDILDASGIPYKKIQGVWKNQIEKRIAGYNACTHRYAMRLDCDELILFDRDRLKNFLDSEYAVGMMHMPTYINSKFMVSLRDESLPVQCFIFDKSKISAEIHLDYLWLILPADKLPSNEKRSFEVYPQPIAFNVHMTSWRSLETSVNRASYYNLNWCRKMGFKGIESLNNRAISQINQLFKVAPPIALRRAFNTDIVALGKVTLDDNEIIINTPIQNQFVSKKIEDIFDNYIKSFIKLNNLTLNQPFFSGRDICFDVSTSDTLRCFSPDGAFKASSSSNIENVTCNIVTLHSTVPYMRTGPLAVEFSSHYFSVNIRINNLENMLRAIIKINIQTNKPDEVNYLTFG